MALRGQLHPANSRDLWNQAHGVLLNIFRAFIPLIQFPCLCTWTGQAVPNQDTLGMPRDVPTASSGPSSAGSAGSASAGQHVGPRVSSARAHPQGVAVQSKPSLMKGHQSPVPAALSRSCSRCLSLQRQGHRDSALLRGGIWE